MRIHSHSSHTATARTLMPSDSAGRSWLCFIEGGLGRRATTGELGAFCFGLVHGDHLSLFDDASGVVSFWPSPCLLVLRLPQESWTPAPLRLPRRVAGGDGAATHLQRALCGRPADRLSLSARLIQVRASSVCPKNQ